MRREDSLCAQPSPLAFGSLVRRLSVVRLSSVTGCSCDLYVRCNHRVWPLDLCGYLALSSHPRDTKLNETPLLPGN